MNLLVSKDFEKLHEKAEKQKSYGKREERKMKRYFTDCRCADFLNLVSFIFLNNKSYLMNLFPSRKMVICFTLLAVYKNRVVTTTL